MNSFDCVVLNEILEFAENGQPVLEWEKRVKIAAGAARGIAYLHEDCNYQSSLFCSLLLTQLLDTL